MYSHSQHCYLEHLADKHTFDNDIAQLASRVDNPTSPPQISSFGTFETRLDLAYLAWPRLKHIFHNESRQHLPAHTTNALRQDGPIQRVKHTNL